MALDSVSNQLTNANSLFKPVPMNKLQQNLSHFYQQTSSFVNEHFDDMSDVEMAGEPKKRMSSSMDEEGMSPRLNPQGVGRYVDILV